MTKNASSKTIDIRLSTELSTVSTSIIFYKYVTKGGNIKQNKEIKMKYLCNIQYKNNYFCNKNVT